jgi:hypothetical protein
MVLNSEKERRALSSAYKFIWRVNTMVRATSGILLRAGIYREQQIFYGYPGHKKLCTSFYANVKSEIPLASHPLNDYVEKPK